MTRSQRLRRRIDLLIWRLVNPPSRALAGRAPWWVVLETTGRRTGEPRRVPLARGPIDGSIAWLIAVHGQHAAFARNIATNRRVRLKVGREWHEGSAKLVPIEEALLSRFSFYARLGPRVVGIDPKLVRVELSA